MGNYSKMKKRLRASSEEQTGLNLLMEGFSKSSSTSPPQVCHSSEREATN